MITALIVDDEPMDARFTESLLLKGFPEIKIIAKASSVVEGIDLINIHQPQLLLLDINLPDGEGFDILKQINKADFEFVFISAFDKYAMEVLKTGGIDYVIKPVTPATLQESIQKALDRIALKSAAQKFEKLQTQFKTPDIPSISVSTTSGEKLIVLSEIIRLEADGNYTKVFLTSGDMLLVSQNIGYYEKKLATVPSFMRVHRAHIVHLKKVIEMQKGRGGYLTMCDKSEIQYTENKSKEIATRLKEVGGIL
jgi:two-component system LytT family response regulator